MRLHMWKHWWELKAKYRRKGLDKRSPMCQSEENIIEHVIKHNKGDKKFNLNDQKENEWGEIQSAKYITKIEKKRRQQKKAKAKRR